MGTSVSEPTKRTSLSMTTKVITLMTGALSTSTLSSKYSSMHSIQTATEMLSTESLTFMQPMTSKEHATTITNKTITSTGSIGKISALTSVSEPTKRTSLSMTTKVITLITGALSTSTLSSKYSSMHSIQTA